jgi:hypothetical protein
MSVVKKQQAKAQNEKRREIKAKKELIKPRSQWLKEAQIEFNKFIRLRDAARPCVSCLRFHNGQYHAGHYLSTGSNPSLRFHEANVHKQCSACNNHLSGNIVNYRRELINRIGLEAVEWLEGPHEPKHYTIDDLKEIKRKYSQLARELEKKNES